MSQTQKGKVFTRRPVRQNFIVQRAESVFSPGAGTVRKRTTAQPGWQCGPPAPCRAGCQQGGPRRRPGLPPMNGGITRSPGYPAGQVHRTAPPSPPPSSLIGQVTPTPPSPSSKSWTPGCPSALLQAPTALCHAPSSPRPWVVCRLLATRPQTQTSPWAKVRNQGSSSLEVPGLAWRLEP